MEFRIHSNKIFLIIVFAATAICTNAQNNTKATTPIGATPPANINLQVYHQGMMLGDYGTAIHAIHYLIASDPSKYGNWQDTLALLYLQTNAYQQAYILSNGLLNSNGYTEMRMAIKATAAKNLQQPVEAITDFTELYNKTNNLSYGFEELQLGYAIRRLAETIVTGNKLMQAIPANDSSKINIAKLDGKTSQQVSFKSAVENIMGLAYIDLKEKDNAVASFTAALKDTPDFEQAKNNLSVATALATDKKQ
jgi:tetratricopeptide (TPR) repeat protein